ncbi:kama family protein [Jackrogersella minutella]|nr:kama family protein [Jackrogersella minutella]
MLSSTRQSYQALARSKGITHIPATSYLVRRISTTQSRHNRATHSAPAQHVPEFSPIPLNQPPQPALPLLRPEQPAEADDEFWRAIPWWKDVSREEFLSWPWSIKNIVEANMGTKKKLIDFLYATLPEMVPSSQASEDLQSRDQFVGDILSGMKKSSMSLRIKPYILSRINWKDPANDPIFRQFIPLGSIMKEDHPMCKLDPLEERRDSPVLGLVHRYPDKALFLATSVCPTLCSYCSRAHEVGADTEMVVKDPSRLSREGIEERFKYIASQEGLHDLIISGGDAFYLQPDLLEELADRSIAAKNIERFRVATKGLAVAPHRFLNDNDLWVNTLIRVSNKARKAGKHMALHTHFNHPNEISWITEQASRKLLQSGVTVRNQSVLLRNVNDNTDTIITLIKKLAKMSIQPYYLYQCDMVPKVEHLRTPLQTLIDIESQIQGVVAGFFVPKCVVDLPGGGGKRPVALRESYDRKTGISTFTQPALEGKDREGKIYRYHDPID